ncbi:MAG: NfeD family protein [Clostridia bacterium]|nr:NfeD family protein [Clostridia bacterium]
MNEIVLFWIVAAAIFGIVECVTPQLVSIWFCGGAVISAIVSYFVDSPIVTVIIFVVSSALLLICTRPIVKKKISVNIQPTNADRIVGKNAVVTLDINPDENVGQIRVDGQIWSARSREFIKSGEKVKIISIEGVKAIVEK